jgi:hypothetical protein
VNAIRPANLAKEGNLKQILRSSGSCQQETRLVKREKRKLMDDWEIMNSLHDSFNEIVYVKFVIDQLNDRLEADDIEGITEAVKALESFYPVYCNSYDKNFAKAWNYFIKPLEN